MSPRKLRVLLLRLSSIPVILALLLVRPRWAVGSDIAVAVESAGYLFLMAGLGVRIWSILYIGGRKSHELVTEGPYSICRNPLYVGTFLLVIGVGLCFENLLVLLATVVVVVPVHVVAARLEERHLMSLFPKEYPLYRQRAPMFWPRFRSYRSRETITVSVRAIRRVLVDTIGILLIPQIEDWLEALHEHGVLPVLWYFP